MADISKIVTPDGTSYDIKDETARTDLSNKANKADTVLTTTLSMGRKANTTVGINSTALGYDVTASGTSSHAEGNSTTASGYQSHAEGGGTTASGVNAHAEGGSTTASGSSSHAEGGSTTASGDYSHAEGGSNTTASGMYSHAEGISTKATGQGSHAEGAGGTYTLSGTTYTSESVGPFDHTEGYQCLTANGQPGNHAEGYQTRATGGAAHSEGHQTLASGSQAHTEGYATTASGTQSHAEGNSTIASGAISHVYGIFNVEDSYSNWSEWTANTSYVVGDKVKVTNGSSVSGYICKIENSDSSFTSSNWIAQSGKMNYAEIVGNGTESNARSNARTLDWDGNERLKGDLYIGCNPDSTGGTKVVPLPSVTSSDNGKFLTVQNGAWTATTMTTWAGGTY